MQLFSQVQEYLNQLDPELPAYTDRDFRWVLGQQNKQKRLRNPIRIILLHQNVK